MVSTTFDDANKLAASAARVARFRKYAWLLDGQFGLPGTRFRFGLNSIIGLAPVAGDVVMGLISLYLVWEARQMGAPTGLQAKMVGNVAIEVVGGAIPIVGDLFDMAFKANLRNLALLEEWMKHA
jgi:hypothetical protein